MLRRRGADGVMVYAFGAYELDTERRLVLRDAGSLRMTPQSYRLLLYIVERAGRVVTSGELCSALWEGCADARQRLRQELSNLRRALGAEAKDAVIATVPSAGYRLAHEPRVRTAGNTSRFVHPEAMRYYADGMALMDRQDATSMDAALRAFEAALRTDSSFAAAHLGAARVGLRRITNHFADTTTIMPMIRRNIDDALRLDPRFLAAELLRCEVDMWVTGDPSVAAARLERVAAVHPETPAVHHALGWARMLRLDSAGAVEETLKAVACEPDDVQLHVALAAACFYHSDFAQAQAELELVIRLEPWRVASRGSLGSVLLLLGRCEEALNILRDPALRHNQSAQAALCWAQARSGDVEAARRTLAMLIARRGAAVSRYCVARCHVGLGERAAAIGALERASGEAQLRLLPLDPWFADLRTDPSFEAVARRHTRIEIGAAVA